MSSEQKALQIEWFNVTYRSVLTLVGMALLILGSAVGYWYYFHVHSPKAGASAAIDRAQLRLSEATRAEVDRTEDVVETLETAEATYHEARELYGGFHYSDARVAAIRSENLSLHVLRLVEGRDEADRMVRFYRIEGDVRVKRAGSFSWDSAKPNMALEVGDQIKTSSSASAELFYFDGTVTTIRPGSLLEIRQLYEHPVTNVRRVTERLERGEIKASTQKQKVNGSFHEVATEKVSARTQEEGEFRVAYDDQKKAAEFDVFSGRIEVASASKKESLVAGEGIRSARGELSAKRLLPGVPVLLSPRDQRVFISERPADEQIKLNWEAVPGAQKYRLLISDQALFTEPLYDAERTSMNATLDGVDMGDYYWKVAAIGESGRSGPFSSHRRFRVSSQRIRDRGDSEPPALEITEFVHVGMMVIVNGRTEPGAMLWADEERVDVDESGAFYSVIRLRKEGNNTLRFVAQDTAGNETALKRSVFVEGI